MKNVHAFGVNWSRRLERQWDDRVLIIIIIIIISIIIIIIILIININNNNNIIIIIVIIFITIVEILTRDLDPRLNTSATHI